MVVGERGTGGSHAGGVVDGGAGGLEGKGSGLGLGTVWRVYIKHSCCDLCCNVVLEEELLLGSMVIVLVSG